jgi:hypothetical protein
MMVRTELESPLQDIIDERLDAIDRVLLRAGVSRGERRRIVEEVEAQVHELLARRNPESPTRADVAAVLDSLDPPEAYAPEEYRHRLAEPAPIREQPRVAQPSLLALGSAAGAVLTLLLAFLAYGLLEGGAGGERDILLLVLGPGVLLAAGAVTACGIAAIRRIRGSGGWLFGLPAALFAAALFPLLLLNGLVVAAMLLCQEYGFIAAIALAFLLVNGSLVYYLWRSVSAGYRRAVPDGR